MCARIGFPASTRKGQFDGIPTDGCIEHGSCLSVSRDWNTLSAPEDHASGMIPSGRAVAVDRALAAMIIFIVVASLVGLGAALAGVFHAPQILIVAVAAAILHLQRTRKNGCAWPGPAPRWRHVVLLVLIALFFRAPVYHYVLGGQDQGLYVNIAHYIEDTGGIAVSDKVERQLENTPFLGQYLASNRSGADGFLAGVYARNRDPGKLSFQFYDVFPVWMAIVGGVFGQTAGVYALTLFALLSIALFYRLTLLLTGSYRSALFAGGLLALSPLHAFFSKFPVTEVPALCFMLAGFMLLAVYWSASPAQRRPGWLAWSGLAFMCAFTTRIDGFMYVPFIIAMAWVALLRDADPPRRCAVQWFALSVTAVYLASVAYGLVWSRDYSRDIYRLSFEPLLGRHWRVFLQALGAVVLAFWFGLAVMAERTRIRERSAAYFDRALQRLPAIIAWLALLLGIARIYRLGWTNHYAGSAGFADMWHLAGAGWTAASASSLWTLVVYMGPLLVLMFLVLVAWRNPDPRLGFLRWLAAGLFAYVALLQWVIPYSPYYARYLLSGLVPSMLLLVVCAWAAMPAGRGKKALSGALVISAVYAAAVSAAQIGKNENDGAYAGLARLTAFVDPADLILLQIPPFSTFDRNQVETPLLYTFHRTTIMVDSRDLQDKRYLAELDSLYDDVFLLTPRDSVPVDFKLVDSVRFRVKSYARNHSFPRQLALSQDIVLNMYRLGRLRIPFDTPFSFAVGGTASAWLHSGWSGQEPWGTWSVGHKAVLSVDLRDLPESAKSILLELDARAFVTESHRVQRIYASVDGSPVGTYTVEYPDAALTMRIPIQVPHAESTERVNVEFSLPDAASPQDLNLNSDDRQLGIALERGRFLPLDGQPESAPLKH